MSVFEASDPQGKRFEEFLQVLALLSPVGLQDDWNFLFI